MPINLKKFPLLEGRSVLCKIFINEVKRPTMYYSEIHLLWAK